MAQKFVDAFKRDPREGYASNFYAFLRRVETGSSFSLYQAQVTRVVPLCGPDL